MSIIRYVLVRFLDMEFQPSDIPKLRGYFARKYPVSHLFHNHLPDGQFSYSYPQIQYRIIANSPALLGFKEGLELIKEVFFDLDHVTIKGIDYPSYEKEIRVYEEPFGICSEMHSYSFSSPWMALNEENHSKYIHLNRIEQNKLLRTILKNNLKTLAKGFDIWLDDFEQVDMDGWFKPVTVNFKDIKMLCFWGEFTTNFIIPEYLGLGKQSARGFGVIVRQQEVT
ncbi:MAG: hypothetical protein FJ042_04490 [Candidatus Cloacimonetes bacterium]|nr:hypothetical protein [Candidatus Cloacimonadota bacterium]